MDQIQIAQAKAHLLASLERVEAGEEVAPSCEGYSSARAQTVAKNFSKASC